MNETTEPKLLGINQALDYFKWKLLNRQTTEKEVQAFNSILKWKQDQENLTLGNHQNFSKLWIHQLILFSRTGLYNGATAIESIDGILSKSTYEWCQVLKNEMWQLKLMAVGSDKYPLEPKDYHNMTKIKERNERIMADYENELQEAFTNETTEEEVIDFVRTQINRAAKKFEKI